MTKQGPPSRRARDLTDVAVAVVVGAILLKLLIVFVVPWAQHLFGGTP